jgi:hypothetical protein
VAATQLIVLTEVGTVGGTGGAVVGIKRRIRRP